MNRNNLLINLGLVFSLLFCLAFACNEGGTTERRSDRTTTTKTDSKRTRTKTGDDEDVPTRDDEVEENRSTSANGGPTEEIVKEKIVEWVERTYEGTSTPMQDVEFHSIRFGNAEKPSSRDALQGATDILYPVQVKYTVNYEGGYKDEHLRFDYYIDSFGEWKMRWSSID